jgi:hypothetical protein
MVHAPHYSLMVMEDPQIPEYIHSIVYIVNVAYHGFGAGINKWMNGRSTSHVISVNKIAWYDHIDASPTVVFGVAKIWEQPQ